MLELLAEPCRLFQVTHCSDKGYSNLSKCNPMSSSLANSISAQISLQGSQDVARMQHIPSLVLPYRVGWLWAATAAM